MAMHAVNIKWVGAVSMTMPTSIPPTCVARVVVVRHASIKGLQVWIQTVMQAIMWSCTHSLVASILAA